eukprot:TRINITY_DN7642_c0_g1_i1.p1 TRINITY_DN7642_c0_g1~~TRINITY_DN7642_c0_g1_i1.p1  ORF type:complete len:419 (-),score=118.31 TRINITY_DN7642_c0_g1_i1:233-1489(-)
MAKALSQEAAEKVLKQVEFYFGESNLPRDRFLKSCISESEDEMVSLAVICSFQRMKAHLGLKDDVPSSTIAAVAEVLRKSSHLKVSEDGTKVGSVDKLEKLEEISREADTRTIAASPLPYDVTLEDAEKFFSQYGAVKCVRLPRHLVTNKAFCGTALVEFSTLEEAQSVRDSKLTYQGADLTVKTKKDFDFERRSFFSEMREERLNHHPKKYERKYSLEEDGFVEGSILAFTLSKARELSDAKTKEEDLAEKENIDEKEAKEPAKALEEEKVPDVAWHDIKKLLETYGSVKYIVYSKGEDTGYVRFEQLEGAQKARTAAVISEDGGLKFNDYILSLEVAEGDALRDYEGKVNVQHERRFSRDRNSYAKRSRHPFQKGGTFGNKNANITGKKHARESDGDDSVTNKHSSKVQKNETNGE